MVYSILLFAIISNADIVNVGKNIEIRKCLFFSKKMIDSTDHRFLVKSWYRIVFYCTSQEFVVNDNIIIVHRRNVSSRKLM